MAKTPLSVARTKVSVGSATADYTQAALAADTYTKISRIRSVPGFSDTYQDISVDEVDDGRTRHGKGTASGTSMEIVCSRQNSDPGQTKMRACADSPLSFNMKFEIPNEGGTFDVYYLSVLVQSKPIGLGGPNDTQTITFTCQPQEAPIEVVAV